MLFRLGKAIGLMAVFTGIWTLLIYMQESELCQTQPWYSVVFGVVTTVLLAVLSLVALCHPPYEDSLP